MKLWWRSFNRSVDVENVSNPDPSHTGHWSCEQASSSLKDAMRLVRSTVICMLTAVVVLLWWELIIHSLFLRAMVLTCALSIAFLVAVHDDPRYDAAVAFAVRCVETLLHKYAPSLVSGGDESNSSGQHSAAGPQWEGFGVSAGGQLVVNHRVVQEVAHVHVVGVPVAISQRCVLCSLSL